MNHSLKTLTIAASLLLAVPLSAAQHKHKTATDHPASGCDNAQYKQQCAKTMTSTFDKTGRLWSAWTNGQYLFVNYSNDKSLSFSKPIRVNNTAEKISARNEHRPKIKISQSGNIYLSWTMKLDKRFTGHIRFSKSTDNGKTFSIPVTVNDNLETISHRFDSLGVNKKGDIFISWLDKRDKTQAAKDGKKYNGAAAYYALSTDQGNSFSKNKKIADNSCECCRMSMAFDRSQLPVIAWRHIYGDNIRDHSIVSFKDKSTPLQPIRLSHDNWKINGCPHHGPSIDIDSQNTYHTAWFNNAKIKHGIFYANSNNQGRTFSIPIQIGNYERKASHADVISSGRSVYIVWQEYLKPHHQLYVIKSDDKGSSWNTPELVSTSLNKTDYPFLVSNQNSIYASWHIPGKKYKLIPISK